MGVTCERVRSEIREIGEYIADLQQIAQNSPRELSENHAQELTTHLLNLSTLINTIRQITLDETRFDHE